MPNIEVLDQQTIDKIAAGEVIERPASVVKELVENAIDAKASAITVEIKEGGISFIRITDNGCGIEKEQVPLAFLRHSTSKIRSVEDLVTVSSLGFRGEALSSIAAVSQVELITKTSQRISGVRYQIEGGKEISLEEIGAPDGTTFLVRNLFYNTPARRKFLKTPQTEAGYIGDLMERLAMSHPEISFKFIVNNQVKLHTSGNSNLKEAIYHIYGRDIAANLLDIQGENELFSVRGFIGKPLISRGNRNFENYFINGRYVKSNLIAKSIEEGYKSFVMQHKYPFTVLHISINGKLLDVNVHPTKMELRFSNGEAVYQFLTKLIRDTINQNELVYQVTLEKERQERARAEQERKARMQADRHVPEPFEKKRLEALKQAVRKDSPYEPKYELQRRVERVPETGLSKNSQSAFEQHTPDSGKAISNNAAAYKNRMAAEENAFFKKQAEPFYSEKKQIEEAVLQEKREVPTESAASQNSIAASQENRKMPTESAASQNSIAASLENRKMPTEEAASQNSIAALLENWKVPTESAASQNSIAASLENRKMPTEGTALQENQEVPTEGAVSSDNTETSWEQITQEPHTQQELEIPQQTEQESFRKLLDIQSRKEHKIIGQLFETYWLVEFDNQLYIIDQHAAHEKVLYERTMASLANKEFTSQTMYPPMLLTLNMQEEALLKKYMDYFQKLGFEIEPFGGKEYSITAIPGNLFGLNGKELMIEILDSLLNFHGNETPQMITEKIASMSCKAAVKGNQKLSRSEIEALIDELLTLENPYHCPHGRPTIISMTKYELEKKFKRVL